MFKRHFADTNRKALASASIRSGVSASVAQHHVCVTHRGNDVVILFDDLAVFAVLQSQFIEQVIVPTFAEDPEAVRLHAVEHCQH